MEQQEAIRLVSGAIQKNAAPQRWADLGCGSGTFTHALAHLLPAGSTIDAVDRARQSLPHTINGIDIRFRRRDFELDDLPLQKLDGILIANALHYCQDAGKVLKKLMQWQQPGHEQFVIVEYDTTAANRWVPYPLPFNKMRSIFETLGLNNIVKLGEHPSLFRRENLYACHVK